MCEKLAQDVITWTCRQLDGSSLKSGALFTVWVVIDMATRVTWVECSAVRDQGPCEQHKARRGPQIVKSPKPRKVRCDNCDSTIEYLPEDLVRMPSLPSSDDVGPLAVRCPKPRCGGRGYPR